MTWSQFGKIVLPTIHHLPLYPSAGFWRGWSLSRLPPGVESCQFACPPTYPGSFSPVSICCRLLRLRLSSFRSLHVRNCWGFRCLMLFPDRSILTMSIGSPDGTWFKSPKKKTDGMSKHRTPFLQRSYVGRKLWHSKKVKLKNGPLGHLEKLEIRSAAFEVFKMFWGSLQLLTFSSWSDVWPHGHEYFPLMVHTVHFLHLWRLRHRCTNQWAPRIPVRMTDVPETSGYSRLVRLHTITWSFVVWHVFDNKLQ